MKEDVPGRESEMYGPEYYAHHCGLPYDRTEPHWLEFFGRIADTIICELRPRRVLDVGCAKGFLVEALRDRGVDAFGFDVSEFAIGQVRRDIRPFCWVASAIDPINDTYDLITCIEVLEHLPETAGITAIRNITAITDTVLFSSTPTDLTEPTHQNVQSVLYWLRLFRDFRFDPDPAFVCSIVSPQAVLLRKSEVRSSDQVLYDVALSRHSAVENALVQHELDQRQQKLDQLQQELGQSQQELHKSREIMEKQDARILDHEKQLQVLQQHVVNLETSFGWRLSKAFRTRRDKVFPLGTRRRRWSDRSLRAMKILLLEGIPALRSTLTKHSQLNASANSDDYAEWLTWNEPSADELQTQRTSKFSYRPLISVIMPTCNPDIGILNEAVQSVINQTYSNWELCIAGSASSDSVAAAISGLSDRDRRIRVRLLSENRGISGNSNECLQLARGEFVTFLDHDDVLAPFALFEVVQQLNNNQQLDFLYTDNDLLAPDGHKRFAPLFKPDWSPEIMLSANYLAHMSVIRKEWVIKVGGLRPEFDGAQDWDLYLRVLSETNRIYHIPKIAYHWRVLPTSAASGIGAKPYAQQSQLEVVARHLRTCGLQATASFVPSGPLRVTWPISGLPLVTIIIPNRDKLPLLKRCIESLQRFTGYRNFEIIIIENGSTEPDTFRYYDDLKRHGNVRVIEYTALFNYSSINNFGVQHARGDLLLFLNNDTEVSNPDWLEEMVRWAERSEIGAVGAKLLYKDGRIQHAGVIVGLTGFAGHIYSGCQEGHWDCFGSAEWYRNFLAVTGACLMVRKEVYMQVGGFDEQFEVCGSDVEFCLRLRRHGYRVVYTPFAKLFHHESSTRGTSIPYTDFQHSFTAYEEYLRQGDPYFNSNLSYWHVVPKYREPNAQTTLQFCRMFVHQGNKQPDHRSDAAGPILKTKKPTQLLLALTKVLAGIRTRIKRRVMNARVSRLIPLWARYSYDATVLANWLDYNDTDILASQSANAWSGYQRFQSVNWFVPDFEHAAFGGIHTILRFADRFKREHGVQNRFVVIGSLSPSRIRTEIRGAFPDLAKEPVNSLRSIEGLAEVPPADISIATLWVTAYFLLKFNLTKRKFYFIQDCEPLFYPAGSTAAQTEATYRFGFFGITNTKTLKDMYEQRYGGTGEFFDPAVDTDIFYPDHTSPRRERLRIFFYGRPDHPRNAFELGLPALKKVKERLGDQVEILSAGAQWNPSDFGVAGILKNLGLLSYKETAELYRTCDIGLLLMLTRHPSYIPFELMASGCLVVSNWNSDTTWLMEHEVNCVLVRPSVSCIADAIVGLANDPKRRQKLRESALDIVRVRFSNWDQQIDKIFTFMCHPKRGDSYELAPAEFQESK